VKQSADKTAPNDRIQKDDDTSVKKRLWNGFKFTIFFCVVLFVLLVIGLFLRSDNFPSGTDKEQWEQYIHNLYEDSGSLFLS